MLGTTKQIITRKARKYKIEKGEIAVHTFGRTGQVVGKISGDTVYKDVSAESAFIHYPKEAIAWTIDALNFIQAMGAAYVDILDKDTGIHYKTTVQKYFDEGEYFDGGKWGEQLKLTLPNFLQTLDPEYISTDMQGQEYTEPTDTGEAKPLHYKSNSPKGITFTKRVKQLDLFGGG